MKLGESASHLRRNMNVNFPLLGVWEFASLVACSRLFYACGLFGSRQLELARSGDLCLVNVCLLENIDITITNTPNNSVQGNCYLGETVS